MAQLFARCRRALRGFRDDRAGNTGMIFAFAAPMLIGGAMMSIEMSQVAKGQSKLQGIADSAAIAAARELRLGNTTKDTVLSVAQSVVEARASSIGTPVVFAGDVPSDKKWVSVELSAETTPSLAGVFGLTPTKVSAQAKAIVMGGAPVCGVTLKDKKNMALNLDKNARLEARNCAVYVNSDGPNALKSKDSATMTSAMTCIVGGKDGLPGSFTPEPTTGCPVFPDPLASRPPPSFGACDPAKTKLVISGEVTSITPGVYCGGLTITKNSDVTAMAGIYIIADGELRVDGASSLKGTDVGFFFTGDKASLDFRKDSVISLAAPKAGSMAGLLFYQDRNAKDGAKFEISSDEATNLLGTIYLPKGRFYSEGEKPIAQSSAYTILIAGEINLSAGPTMVLNSNYALSDVPVPDGVGNLSGKVALDR